MDPNNVYVRTTTERVVEADSDGGPRTCGAAAPDAQATWGDYGGKHPAQPTQNMILFDELDDTPFQLLDVAPLSLALANATFDCAHHCHPRDLDTWVSLLLNRLSKIP